MGVVFRPILPSDYEIVRRLDNLSFKKGECYRSVENVTNLAMANPDGCFLAINNCRPVGFIFCRTFGAIGYMGPLGVEPEEQNKGYGKQLVQKGLEYLTARKCQVIGLETMPEWGKNIGLYHKLGFRATLPSRVMEKLMPGCTVDKIPSSLRFGNDFSPDVFSGIIAEIKEWTDLIYPGLDFSKDLQCFLQSYPERILFRVYKGKITGFIAFAPDFNRYGWGAIKPSANDDVHLGELLSGVENANWGEKIMFRFHTRFNRITDILFRYKYNLSSDMTCMLLTGKTGEFENHSKSLHLRPWVG